MEWTNQWRHCIVLVLASFHPPSRCSTPPFKRQLGYVCVSHQLFAWTGVPWYTSLYELMQSPVEGCPFPPSLPFYTVSLFMHSFTSLAICLFVFFSSSMHVQGLLLIYLVIYACRDEIFRRHIEANTRWRPSLFLFYPSQMNERCKMYGSVFRMQ